MNSTAQILLCNPYICDGKHSKLLSTDQIELVLSEYTSLNHIGFNFAALIVCEPKISFEIGYLARAIAEPAVSLPVNRAHLITFQENINAMLERVLNFDDDKALVHYYQLYLDQCGAFFEDSVCLNNLPSLVSPSSILMLTDAMLIKVHLVSEEQEDRIKIKSKNWSENQNYTFLNSVIAEIIVLIQSTLVNSLITKWFEYVSVTISTTKVYQIAINMRQLTQSHRMKNELGAPELDKIYEKTPDLVQRALVFWYNGNASSLADGPTDLRRKNMNKPTRPPGTEHLQTLKVEAADKLAKTKKYADAITFYEIINFSSSENPSSLRLQSLTNCAALRLRMCGEDERQIPAISPVIPSKRFRCVTVSDSRICSFCYFSTASPPRCSSSSILSFTKSLLPIR